MPRNCCVPFCKSGYISEIKNNKRLGISNPTLFQVPKDHALRQEWERNIKRDDRTLTEKDLVCSLHFHEDLILEYYETKHLDGTISKIRRGKLGLKPNAIPTVFPNYPENILEQVVSSRKRKTSKSSIISGKRSHINEVENNGNEISNSHRNENLNTTNFCHGSTIIDINFEIIIDELTNIFRAPSQWIFTKTTDDKYIILMLLDNFENFTSTKRIVIDDKLFVKVFIKDINIAVKCFSAIKTREDIIQLIKVVEEMQICATVSNRPTVNQKHKCNGFVSSKSTLCYPCTLNQKKISDSQKLKNHLLKIRRKSKNYKKRTNYFQRKMMDLKLVMRKMQKQYSCSANMQILKEEIKSLPENQQENIMACINATKYSSNGQRYTRRFIYECILLKIKSRKAYNFLRKRKLLQLPSLATIYRYICKMKSSFGFNDSVFQVMKTKAENMKPEEKRGILLLDEMSLSPQLKFDKTDLKVIGFTDIGKYTPNEQKSQLGDHALVFMYQPFRGQWVQSIAAFLSKGAATGTVLVQLIIEAIILLENSGFHVDGVVTDGAQWNRNMLKQFGITNQVTSCEHITDASRRLWFFSDFPHLIKNLWGWITTKRQIYTSEGEVKLSHWEALFNVENKLSLKACPKLDESHLNPTKYERMNVARAYQFFSRNVSSAMKMYQPDIKELQDCDATCKFIDRIHDLIHAFSSNSPKSALRQSCSERQIIIDFLKYIDQNCNIMSKSTWFGLKLTCSAAIEISDFLLLLCDYDYVMLNRLNQDNLERFFGILRAACGNNDHPDPALFLIIFRLMNTYSLVKPPRGSNIAGEDLLNTLIKTEDLDNDNQKNKWSIIRSTIINKSKTINKHINPAHSTCNDKILEYVSGYVIKKTINFKKCPDCEKHLLSDKDTRGLITLRDYFGVLYRPNENVVNLINVIEKTIMLEVGEKRVLHSDTFFKIAYRLQELQAVPRVGCDVHSSEVTSYIIQFYLIFRMNLLCTELKKKAKANSKIKHLRKTGKVITPSVAPHL